MSTIFWLSGKHQHEHKPSSKQGKYNCERSGISVYPPERLPLTCWTVRRALRVLVCSLEFSPKELLAKKLPSMSLNCPVGWRVNLLLLLFGWWWMVVLDDVGCMGMWGVLWGYSNFLFPLNLCFALLIWGLDDSRIATARSSWGLWTFLQQLERLH